MVVFSLTKKKPRTLWVPGASFEEWIRLESSSRHPMGDMVAGMMAGGEDHEITFELSS